MPALRGRVMQNALCAGAMRAVRISCPVPTGRRLTSSLEGLASASAAAASVVVWTVVEAYSMRHTTDPSTARMKDREANISGDLA